MKIATLIKDNLPDFQGHAALFRCDPPHEGNEFVVCSSIGAAFDTGLPETYIFPSNPTGEVSDFGELEGSIRGDTTHAEVLMSVGYTVKENK